MASSTKALKKLIDKATAIQKKQVPDIVAEKATEYFKERFVTKEWDKKPWKVANKAPKRGSLMLRSGNLMNSIRPVKISEQQIIIAAGNSKVPYAQIHNKGGTIKLHPRTELFVRKRYKKGKHKGKFARGTTQGRGFAHKGAVINMPKRQFMGDSIYLRKQLLNDIKIAFKPILK